MSKLSKSLIGPVEKREELEPVYFLSKLSKSLIGPVEKRKAKRENNMRKYARIGAAASSKVRPVTLLQGAPHPPRGACYAGWKKAARRLYAAMLLHFLLANFFKKARRQRVS